MIQSHSFQNLNAPDDQAACLENIWQHLKPGGLLVIHLDHMSSENMRWLGEISGDKGGIFEEGESFNHPKTGLLIKPWAAWSYEPATQTAVLQSVWEEIGEDGEPTRRWDTGPTSLHCAFRFEMEHLLKRAGFEIEDVYGDFYRQELKDDSSHMIWLAKKVVE